MMGRTHALLGLASLWLLEPLPHVLDDDSLSLLALAPTFGALLPDLDAAGSTLKYLKIGGLTPFVPLSEILHRTYGHRGLLHSGRGLLTATLLLSPLALLEWRLWVGTALGYASHLAGDAATRSGIPLLFPNRRRFHLLPQGWRLTTGSRAEDTVLIGIAGLDLLLLLRHLPLPPA